LKLWIDECLSPTLVKRANRRGFWATCNRDRDLLGELDEKLYPLVLDEEAVFVTNNESDFLSLAREIGLHSGLVVLPQGPRRETQWLLLDKAIDHIEAHAEAHDEAPTDWMVNRYVEIDPEGVAWHRDLP
jgi:predicted nuclease of predicted toxin-antitoxin system